MCLEGVIALAMHHYSGVLLDVARIFKNANPFIKHTAPLVLSFVYNVYLITLIDNVYGRKMVDDLIVE